MRQQRGFLEVSLIKIKWLTLEQSPLVNLGMVLYYDRVAMGYTMYSSIHWAELTESQISSLSAKPNLNNKHFIM